MRATVHRTLGALAAASAVWTCARWARYVAGDAGIARYHVETATFIFALVVFGALASARRTSDDAVDGISDHNRITVAAAPLFVLAALALYWPSLSVGFLSDDYGLVAHAERGRIGAITPSFLRPVPMGVWAVLLAAGAGPVVLHLLNVVLHGIVAWLTTKVAAGWALGRRGSIVTGLLVLVLPTSTEAVVWTSGVFDLTATTFALVAVLVARGYGARTPLARRLALAGVIGAAVLSKETAAVAIGLVVIDALARRALTRTLVLDASCIAVAMTAYLIVRLGGDPGVGVDNVRYAIQRGIFQTFGAFAAPWHADVLTARPVIAPITIALVSAIAVCAAVARARSLEMRVVTAPLAWMLTAIALAIPVLVVPGDLQASRYLYLAGIGWASLLVMLSLRLPAARLRRVTAVALAVLGLLYAAGARSHQRHWVDAAATRAAVLDAARSQPDLSRCRPAVIHHLPDNVRGAYLFRNSVPEFFQRELGFEVITTGTLPGCTFVWQPETRTLVPTRD